MPNNRFLLMGIAALLLACGGEVTEEQALTNSDVSMSEARSIKTVMLSPEEEASMAIEVVEVERAPLQFELRAPGTVYPAPEQISVVASPISGRIAEIFAHEGEQVRKGDRLVTLESLEYANLLAEFMEHVAETVFLEQQLSRVQTLVSQEISAQRTLDRTQADFNRARTQLSASKARLKALGITDEQLATWQEGEIEPSARLIIYADIDGVVNEHLIDLGSSVAANDRMLDIINPSEVLVRAFVSPDDAVYISSGNTVRIEQPNAQRSVSSNRFLETKVTTIQPALDELNRAVPVNIITKSTDGWPIIGQNLRVVIQVEAETEAIRIPISAVEFEESGATVFVQLSQREYEKRSIVLSRITSDYVVVQEGLEAGERVAISNVFDLKALEKFSEFAE